MWFADRFDRLLVLQILALGAIAQTSAQAEPIPIVEKSGTAAIDFEGEVLTIFRKKCLACHNATEAQGELVLESPESIRKGGSEGQAVVPGKSAESLLLKLASRQKEPHMPPPDNEVKAAPLTPEELGVIRRWIDEGAKGELRSSKKITWQALPSSIRPIYATAITADGHYAAASRGNQVFLVHLPTQREVCTLSDPGLAAGGSLPEGGIADLDLVQSLKFNPAGTLLATGGFRTVKLWAKPFPTKKQRFDFSGGEATCLALSPDGKFAAFGFQSGAVQVFDISNGVAKAPIPGEGAPVSAVAFSADGKNIFTGSDTKLRVASLADVSKTAQLETPSPIHALVIPSGDKQIVTAHSDGSLRVWDQPVGDAAWQSPAVKTLSGHQGAIHFLATCGKEGKLIASGGADGVIRVWDLSTGKSVKEMKQGTSITGLASSPDGQQLATAGGPVARLWNLESGQQVAELKGDLQSRIEIEKLTRAASLAKKHVELAKKDLEDAKKSKTGEEENQKKAAEALTKAEGELKPKSEAVTKAADDKAGAEKSLAAVTEAKTKAGKAKQNAEEIAQKASEAVTSAKSTQELAAKAEGEAAKALTAAAEKTAIAVNALKEALTPWSETLQKAAHEADAAVTETEKKLKELAEKHQKTLDEQTVAQRTLDTAKRGVERALEAVKTAAAALPGFEKAVEEATQTSTKREEALASAQKSSPASDLKFHGIAFAADGKTVIAAGADGRCFNWDSASGVPIGSFQGDADAALVGVGSAGGIMIAGKLGGAVWEWPTQWQLQQTIGSPDDPSQLVDRVTALDFSPDGKMLAAGGGEASRSGEIKLFSVPDGKLLRVIQEPHSDTVSTLAFSPTGQQLASGAADRFAKCWNVADGQFVRSLEGHTHHVLGAAWRADGRVLVTSGADAVLKVWDARTGEQQRTVQNQFSKEVSGICFLADGDLAVASGGDAKVRIINTANGNQQKDLAGATDYMYCVAASADGKTILAGGLDGVLRVWNDEGKEIAKFSPAPSATPRTAAK